MQHVASTLAEGIVTRLGPVGSQKDATMSNAERCPEVRKTRREKGKDNSNNKDNVKGMHSLLSCKGELNKPNPSAQFLRVKFQLVESPSIYSVAGTHLTDA